MKVFLISEVYTPLYLKNSIAIGWLLKFRHWQKFLVLCFFLFSSFATKAYYILQTSLKLMDSSDPPASDLQIIWNIGTHHCNCFDFLLAGSQCVALESWLTLNSQRYTCLCWVLGSKVCTIILSLDCIMLPQQNI